jgi:hypothetical protein
MMRFIRKEGKVATTEMKSSVSLGVGTFSMDGAVYFQAAGSVTTTGSISSLEDSTVWPKEKSKMKRLRNMFHKPEHIIHIPTSVRELPSQISEKILRPVSFKKIKSWYLRVADLQMSETSHSAANEFDEVVPNFHHASVHPPPGVDKDPSEMWVAIDDGSGSYAPIAPYAMDALAKFGRQSAMDQSMWTPDKKTEKLIKAGNCCAWQSCVWQEEGLLVLPPQGFPEENEVMVWSGSFNHGLYGSDLPAVRASGIVNMSAKSLTTLLLDSTRVKEYNHMALGRTEIMVMPGGLEEDGPFGKSVTKVLRSESKPPLLRKVLQFVSIMQAKELPDGSGYLVVSRAVTQANHGVFDPNILLSEILMGVNVIRKVEGDENRCLMINVNHIRSPMIPMMIAKKIGLSAAVNFINDLRALC